MKLKFYVPGLLGVLAAAAVGAAAEPLTSATVTEAKNIVVQRTPAGAERPAKVSDIVQGADILRTGERSLAEMQFNDRTVTRLGANSLFSFAGAAREFRPGAGTVLISVPKAIGGGRIVTAPITAAIEGTTVIVQTSNLPPAPGQNAPRQLIKMIFVEGHGTLTMTNPSGKCPVTKRKIGPGQMIAQYSDQPCLAEVVDVQLDVLVNNSLIFTGFSTPLPNIAAIQDAIAHQAGEILRGTLASGGPNTGISGLDPQGSTEPGLHDPPQSQGGGGGRQPGLIYLGNGFYLNTGNPQIPVPGFDGNPVENGSGEILRKH